MAPYPLIRTVKLNVESVHQTPHRLLGLPRHCKLEAATVGSTVRTSATASVVQTSRPRCLVAVLNLTASVQLEPIDPKAYVSTVQKILFPTRIVRVSITAGAKWDTLVRVGTIVPDVIPSKALGV